MGGGGVEVLLGVGPGVIITPLAGTGILPENSGRTRLGPMGVAWVFSIFNCILNVTPASQPAKAPCPSHGPACEVLAFWSE